MAKKKRVVAAFSGGKDSTALAYLLKPKFLLYTSTGNELPPVENHIRRVARDLKAKIIRPPGPTLDDLIKRFKALPNFRMRWCTRMIKVVPAIQWMEDNPDVTLAVGLRYDEPSREGIYGLEPGRFIFPLRDKKWGLQEVLRSLECRNIKVPERTDCAICFFQRLGEWYQLWKRWPKYWKQGEAWERKTGHTFRSPSRDTWPASMKGLRQRFEKGDVPRCGDTVIKRERGCRVCSL